MTKAVFTVREEIEPKDRHKVFSLLNSSGMFLPREMSYGMDLFDEHLRKGENSHYRFMLHEQDGMLLAFGCYGALTLTDHRYHLHWMAVERNCQHQGIGLQLEKAISARIRTDGGVKIYAQTSNRTYHEAARAFYRNCGYSPAATVPDYYGEADDMVFYVKDLLTNLS